MKNTNKKKWTLFWDMHSGGKQKEKWSHIYIEAPENEARIIFYNKFGHNPDRVTCTCCGEDYAVSEGDSLKQISAYHSIKQEDILVIYAKDIKDEERVGEVPEQGYVWV